MKNIPRMLSSEHSGILKERSRATVHQAVTIPIERKSNIMGAIVSRRGCKVAIADPEDWASYFDETNTQAWANLRTGTLTYEPQTCNWSVDHDGTWCHKPTGHVAPAGKATSRPQVRHFPSAMSPDLQGYDTLPPIAGMVH